MDRELRHVWDGLVASLTNSSQGLFMHASWIFVACMTIVMTVISIGRIIPSRKSRRLRRIVAVQSRTVKGVGKHRARAESEQ